MLANLPRLITTAIAFGFLSTTVGLGQAPADRGESATPKRPADAWKTGETIAGGTSTLPLLPVKPSRPLLGPIGVLQFVEHVTSHRPDGATEQSIFGSPIPGQTIGGFAPVAPLLPERPPRPQKGPEGVEAFLESISSHQPDAAFEVVLGRPRILTLKEPLGDEAGQTSISVGDPSILDFHLLSRKKVRIIGRGPGVSDLAFSLPNDQTFTFRVFVVYDLDTLKQQLTGAVPQARVHLQQMREHVIAEGDARSSAEAAKIGEILDAYRKSVEAQIQNTSSQPAR